MKRQWLHPDDPGDVEGKTTSEPSAEVVQAPETPEPAIPELGDDVVVEAPPRSDENPFEGRLSNLEAKLDKLPGELKDLLSKQTGIKARADYDEDEDETPSAKRLRSEIAGISESIEGIKAHQEQQKKDNKRYSDQSQVYTVNNQAAIILDECNAGHKLTTSQHPACQKVAKQVKAAVMRRVHQLVVSDPTNHGLTVDHIKHMWSEELSPLRELLQAASAGEDVGKQAAENAASGVEAGAGAPPTDKTPPIQSPDSEGYWEDKRQKIGNRVSNRVATRQASQ